MREEKEEDETKRKRKSLIVLRRNREMDKVGGTERNVREGSDVWGASERKEREEKELARKEKDLQRM